MSYRSSWVLLASFAFGGCSGPTTPEELVELRTDRGAYDRGEAINLILQNSSAERAYYNLCFSRLERRQGAGWIQASLHAPGQEYCLTSLGILDPGETTTRSFTIGEWMTPGIHRIWTEVERQDGSLSVEFDVVTPEFEIENDV